ncbi:MAG: TonB-dependent receptor, partial [Novosphingobium sp.]
MRNYPPESIRRMEILPEEVALRYGYPPDARVINFILKDNFRSRTVEAKFSLPTRGGFSTWSLEGTQLKIQGSSRLSVTVNTDDTSPLTEAERGVIQAATPAPSKPDPAQYRTLIADSRNFGGNVSWSKGLGKDGKGGQLSLNGNVTRADSRSGSGLDALLAPLERINHTTEVSGGAGLNTNFGPWQFSATTDATFGKNETLIDRFSGTGYDTAISDTKRLTSLATLTGRPFRLPAGEATATFRTGYNWGNIQSSDTRSTASADLTRGTLFGGFNLALPLTSRRDNVLGAVGDISLNFSAGYDHVSDFGGVADWSAGLTWKPTERLGLQASYIVNEVAPSLSQLGLPQTQTFNVPVYDFTTGQTVLATVIGGGNPDLVKERQRDLKLSANWQIPGLNNSSLLVEYFRNNSTDVSASFPLLTPAIEAAFPGRVVRDGAGNILSVDQRPVTLAEQKGSRLRWGLNIGGPIGKPSEGGGMMGGMFGGGGGRGGGGRPPGAGGGGRGPGGGGMMGAMFGGQGRWNLGLYHTVQFDSTVLIAPGVPVLNLLDGDALSGGGTPRHSLEFNGGAFYKGFGTFVQGTWAAPTAVRASGAPGTSDLHFGALAKVNVNLFADLGRMPKLTKAVPFFKGARLSLGIDNLFDARQKVTDAGGAVPLSYQPDYLDPRGRVVSLSFRKLF